MYVFRVKELGAYGGYTVAFVTALINSAVVTAHAAEAVELLEKNKQTTKMFSGSGCSVYIFSL